MIIQHRWIHRILHRIRPVPFHCAHIEYSAIASACDQPGQPTQRLFDIALPAIARASKLDLTPLSRRIRQGPHYPSVWPGEHYKLLGGLMCILQPRTVVEIGTFQGLSALAMLNSLPADAQLTTLDIVPWTDIPSSVLVEADFKDGRLRQRIGNLLQPRFFEAFRPELEACDFLFLDGPKDVQFERALLARLDAMTLKQNLVVMLDDIRKWNMLALWRHLDRPKLDLTSFGHWSGTGLVDWNGRE